MELRAQQHAGMREIKAALDESNRRIVVCNAGQNYLHHVQLCQVSTLIIQLTQRFKTNIGQMHFVCLMYVISYVQIFTADFLVKIKKIDKCKNI